MHIWVTTVLRHKQNYTQKFEKRSKKNRPDEEKTKEISRRKFCKGMMENTWSVSTKSS